MFFPTPFKRIWMPSRPCCCIAVLLFTCMPQVWVVSACLENAKVSAFHFVHTALDVFLCLIITLGIMLFFWHFDWTFSTSVLQDRHLLCGIMYYCVLAGPTLPPTGPRAVLISVKLCDSQAPTPLRSSWFINFNRQIVKKVQTRFF